MISIGTLNVEVIERTVKFGKLTFLSGMISCSKEDFFMTKLNNHLVIIQLYSMVTSHIGNGYD